VNHLSQNDIQTLECFVILSLRNEAARKRQTRRRRVPVPVSDLLMPLRLALSEKQIPQITENTQKSK
jgi:hypothetical protein